MERETDGADVLVNSLDLEKYMTSEILKLWNY